MSRLRRFAQTTLVHSYSLQAANLILASAWVFSVGAESFGLGALTLSWLSIGFAVYDTGLAASIVSPVELTRARVGAALLQQLILFAVASIVFVVLVAAKVIAWPGADARTLSAVFVPLIGLIAVARLRLQLLYRNLEARALAAVRWVGLMVRYGAAVGGLVAGEIRYALVIGVLLGYVVEHVAALIISRGTSEAQLEFLWVDPRVGLSDRLAGAGEQYLAELRRHADVLILSGGIEPALLGLYAYASRIILRVRDASLSPVSNVLLMYFVNSRDNLQRASREYLISLRLASRVLTPAIVLVSYLVYLVATGTRATADAPEWYIGIALWTALTAPLYTSGAYLYSLSKFWTLTRYNLALTLMYVACYLLIHETSITAVFAWTGVLGLLNLVAFERFVFRSVKPITTGRYYRAAWPSLLGGGVLTLLHLTAPVYGVGVCVLWFGTGLYLEQGVITTILIRFRGKRRRLSNRER